MPASATLYGVLADHVDLIWDEARPFLERVVPYTDGKYAIEDIYAGIVGRDMQLWVVLDEDVIAAIVTQIQVFPRKKVANIFMCGGDGIHSWLYVHEHLANWARDNGCAAIEFFGRPGWEKLLPAYKKIHTVLRRELTH